MRNAKDFNEGKLKDFNQVGLRVIDDFTFEVTLENPTPFFLDLCCFTTLLPVHVPTVERCEKAGLNWTKPGNLVGNGAFTLKEWRLFDRIRLVRSETYWNKANVGMKSIDVLPSGASEDGVQLLRDRPRRHHGRQRARAHAADE